MAQSMTQAAPHMPAPVTVAYNRAAAAFQEAVTANEPLLPFVMGMRAISDGVPFGVLPEAEHGHLAALIEGCRPILIGLAHTHAADAARQAGPYIWSLDPRQALADVQQTLALAKAWATPLDARGTWHPGYLDGHCAFIRLLANGIESVVWSELAYCGVFNQPDPIREQAEGLVLDSRSMSNAALSQPRTRH